MRLVDIMIIVATILATMFPAFLVNAIRTKDDESAGKSKLVACILFGALTFIALVIVNS